MPGVEVAVEGLLRDGELTVLAVFDKPDPLDGPYFEETIYVTPSRLPAEALGPRRDRRPHVRARRSAWSRGRCTRSCGSTCDGDGDRVHVIEVAARSIGGLCARTLRFGAGIALEELVLRHALGMPLDGLEREPAASGVMMLPIPAAGTLREVGGQDAARDGPGRHRAGDHHPARPCRSSRCPRATATSGSCSHGATRPPPSRTPCAPPTPPSTSSSTPSLDRVRILLVATYELGQQPGAVGAAAAHLRAHGHDVRALDVSVDPWDPVRSRVGRRGGVLGADAHRDPTRPRPRPRRRQAGARLRPLRGAVPRLRRRRSAWAIERGR